MTPRAVVSIVVPVYYNGLNLRDTIPRLLALRERMDDCDVELVFVDDGSGDDSVDILREFQAAYPADITLVRLTRNFGAMAATQAGLSVATGDCVGVIAADLQDPPDLFVEMVRLWRAGTKAVFGVRAQREDSLRQRLFASLYYRLMRRFAVPNYPQGGFDFFLIDRQVVGAVNAAREKNTNLMTLIWWLGFPAVLLPYVRVRREKGRSRWTLGKRIKLVIDSFVAFSYVPIRLLSIVGLLLAFGAFAYGSAIFYAWARHGIAVKGYAPIMIVLALASGMQMMMLGVLGEYLWRTLDEVRRRPAFVIDELAPRRVASSDMRTGRPTAPEPSRAAGLSS